VFFDEATAALSAEYADLVFDEVRELQRNGVAIVFISHRLGEIEALCQRSTVLRDGVVAGVVETSKTSSQEIISLMLGRSEPLSVAVRTASRSTGEVVLDVQNLTVGSSLRDASFSIRRGEVVGLAALDGQGQDQLFECLSGLRPSDRGTISIAGKSARFSHPADAIDAGIALIPAERDQALLRASSVDENVWLPKLRSPRNWGFIAKQQRKAAVTKVAHELSIDMRAGREVRLLSGGNQQKVVVARWLCSGFDVLLCFDPTRGIDVGAKQQMFDLVRDVASRGAAVLYFTSDLTEIQQVSDRSLVLFAGELVAELSGVDSTEARLLHAAHGLPPKESSPTNLEAMG
jgi:ribose transport system ATP-binding protein